MVIRVNAVRAFITSSRPNGMQFTRAAEMLFASFVAVASVNKSIITVFFLFPA
jgi:hypothetical protein